MYFMCFFLSVELDENDFAEIWHNLDLVGIKAEFPFLALFRELYKRYRQNSKDKFR